MIRKMCLTASCLTCFVSAQTTSLIYDDVPTAATCLTGESHVNFAPQLMQRVRTQRAATKLQPDSKVVIDLQFVYDRESSKSYFDRNKLSQNQFAFEALQSINAAMRNSQLNIEFRLVGQMTPENYQITQGDRNIFTLANELAFTDLYYDSFKTEGNYALTVDDFQNKQNKGLFTGLESSEAAVNRYQEILKNRDSVGADLTVYFVDEGFTSGGIANTLNSKEGNKHAAFAVVNLEYALSQYSLIHEIGHLLGSGHDKGHGGPQKVFGPPAAGWIFDRANSPNKVVKYATTMAYATNANKQITDTLRVPVFSSPSLNYPTTEVTGDKSADSRSIFIEVAPAVSQYRDGAKPIELSKAVDLNTAADNSLTFKTGGESNIGKPQKWFGQTLTTADDQDALQSGHVGYLESSWLETEVTGPGQLSFKWKISAADPYYSAFKFTIDDEEQRGVFKDSYTIENNKPIRQPMSGFKTARFDIPKGKHTLRWTHSRFDYNSNFSSGLSSYPKAANAIWLDRVCYKAKNDDGDTKSPSDISMPFRDSFELSTSNKIENCEPE